MNRIHAFFKAIDAAWGRPQRTKIPLHIIGSTALMIQTNYDRGTKDSDTLETKELGPNIQTHLLELAGKDTEIHDKHRMYIEIVSSGIPFLPHSPNYHLQNDINAQLGHFKLLALDVIDVVVSKLKRFNANDLSDIAAMVEQDRVPHEKLIQRFNSAVDCFSHDARADDLPKYIANLRQIERDLFGVSETVIELPSWV